VSKKVQSFGLLIVSSCCWLHYR